MAQLSQLKSFDLHYASIAMPNFGELIANSTELRELSLLGVAFDSIVPPSLTNLSCLMSLQLSDCSLQETSIQDSIVLTFKGIDRELNGVLTTLAAIDLSSNRFRGAIPDLIGELILVRYLNLSHNNFTGSMPPSLGNLNVIEFLYLSSNQLTSQIPRELVNLHFLVNFSVADNKLDGAIPHSEQFNSFENSSCLENIRLCGAPLSKKCEEYGSLPPQPPLAKNDPTSVDLDE
ncbi:hypothetical protein Nepgr_007641 [Nepenthes gracilis]|uniref:Uncharacterized protein n=1 Tax=Nepenthes gracilis TaxID=150966 RepID=A0AAD3S7L9_NEPGR|nr:hypothetical protein Nepgr_007641 [Nepenthes gracilis]